MSLIDIFAKFEGKKPHQDSMAYQLVGKKCVFCRDTITNKDVMPPLGCYENTDGDPAHHTCLQYAMKKYPDVPLDHLKGKIQRTLVRSFDERKI